MAEETSSIDFVMSSLLVNKTGNWSSKCFENHTLLIKDELESNRFFLRFVSGKKFGLPAV